MRHYTGLFNSLRRLVIAWEITLSISFFFGALVKPLQLTFALALLAIGSAAYAVGNVQGATIVSVDSRADGLFLITLSQGSTTPPACVTVFNRMSGNANTAGGKAVLAGAMLAYATGGRVELAQGTGACGEYAGIESIMILQQSR